MCVYSMIVDHYHDKWKPRLPSEFQPELPGIPPAMNPIPTISPEEIAEFRKLLERAREYDKKFNEPDCEVEEKLTKLAKELGVEITFI